MLVEQRSGAGAVGPTSSLLALQILSGPDLGLSLPESPLWGAGCDSGLAERLAPRGGTSWRSPGDVCPCHSWCW